jgi:DNA phosphorothioation-associated putative methyltransferase
MICSKFKQLTNALNIGKRLPDAIYLHRSAQQSIPPELRTILGDAEACLKTTADWNVLKLYTRKNQVSFLKYINFFEDAFPILETAISLDLESEKTTIRSYRESVNPPILHKKELLILRDHPQFNVFAEITLKAELMGLYATKSPIGFLRHWNTILAEKKITVIGNTIQEN